MKKVVLIGVLITLGLVLFISPFASKSPDGLEKVAENKGFIHKSKNKEIINAPLSGYSIPGIKKAKVSTSLAGVIGVVTTFSLAFILGYFLKTSKK